MFGDGPRRWRGAGLRRRDERGDRVDVTGTAPDRLGEFLFGPRAHQFGAAARLVRPVMKDRGGLGEGQRRSLVSRASEDLAGRGESEDRVGFFGAVEGENHRRPLGSAAECEVLDGARVGARDRLPEDRRLERIVDRVGDERPAGRRRDRRRRVVGGDDGDRGLAGDGFGRDGDRIAHGVGVELRYPDDLDGCSAAPDDDGSGAGRAVAVVVGDREGDGVDRVVGEREGC